MKACVATGEKRKMEYREMPMPDSTFRRSVPTLLGKVDSDQLPMLFDQSRMTFHAGNQFFSRCRTGLADRFQVISHSDTP